MMRLVELDWDRDSETCGAIVLGSWWWDLWNQIRVVIMRMVERN